MKKMFWVLIIFGVPMMLAVADETTPLVVWTDDGDVWVWQNGETTSIPIGDANFPYLSPNGEQIALVRGAYLYFEKLSVVSLNGENLRDIDLSAYPRQVIWQSETVLWVNDFASLEGALGLPYGTMLYRINLETGDIASWDMGEPFMMTINPSRDTLALSFGGVYQVDEGHISLLSLTEENPQPREALRFPAISNGSHEGHYPSVQWFDETTFGVAIPQPDAVYILREREDITISLWQIAVSQSEAMQLGEIDTRYGILLFEPPVWSNDSLGYFTHINDELHLMITSVDGQTIYHQIPFDLLPAISPVNIPTTSLIAYNQDIALMMFVTKDMPPTLWFSAGGAFLGELYASDRGVVFLRLGGTETTLMYIGVDETEPHAIAKIKYYAFFDAKWD